MRSNPYVAMFTSFFERIKRVNSPENVYLAGLDYMLAHLLDERDRVCEAIHAQENDITAHEVPVTRLMSEDEVKSKLK